MGKRPRPLIRASAVFLLLGGLLLSWGAFTQSLPNRIFDDSFEQAVTPTNHPPAITSAPITSATVGQAYSYDVNATDPDAGDVLSYALTVKPTGMTINATTGLITWTPVAAQVGANSVAVRVTDKGGLTATQSFTVTVVKLPADPGTTAPPTDPTVITTVSDATGFLYTGTNPIQTGVAPGTIDPKRVAVLRGKVIDRNGAPLSGALITVLSHPEFGQTLSRADGVFDMAVNGGGVLVVNYVKAGFLPAQRKTATVWQDWFLLPDVVLIPRDSAVTPVNFAAPGLKVARATPQTDTDGTRRATALIPAGTQAQIYQPNGTLQTVNALNLRFTEFTVGPRGPAAMPGDLPPSSAYTYAVELGADEATTKIAGKDVLFSQDVFLYLENFLKFPVGMSVPTGYYDRAKAAWIPTANGRVIKIVSISGGLANLDTDGNGSADNGATLGVTTAERQQLASLYPAGTTLWRVATRHFSTIDCNWPLMPPLDAIRELLDSLLPDWVKKLFDDPCIKLGNSIIECENQVLGEAIPLVGAPFALHYASDRMAGRTAANTLSIPIARNPLPPSLKRIEVEVIVGGKKTTQTLPTTPNQTFTFQWDGQDVYGRPLIGVQRATLRVGYVYNAVYATPAQRQQAFGLFSGIPLSNNRARQEYTLWSEATASVGAWESRRPTVGGWSLTVHHVYDPLGKTLYLGDGSRRSIQDAKSSVITTVAGGGTDGLGDGDQATAALLNRPTGIALAPDGSLYIADMFTQRIRRVSPAGIITTVAGNGVQAFRGDGGPATAASLFNPTGVTLGPDGSFYIADFGNNRVRWVAPGGIITTLAGTGQGGFSGDGGPATAAALGTPVAVALAPDGSLYIAHCCLNGNIRVRRVAPGGIITTVAGTGQGGFSGDGGPATAATLKLPRSIALAADGSLYIADDRRVRRVTPDGIITTVAGNGLSGFSGDGGPATSAGMSLMGVALGPDGRLYILDDPRVRRVGQDGIITTVAGNGQSNFSGDGGPATAAALVGGGGGTGGIAVAPDGSLYIADRGNNRIRRVAHLLAGFNATDLAIASADGAAVYRFTAEGRHLSTVNALTGATLYSFTYDDAGRLIKITDGDNNVTTIQRDVAGNPSAIVAPFGQRTTLAVDADGYLKSVTNPANEPYTLLYKAGGGGLLTRFTDPRGNASTYGYDAQGRLTSAANAALGGQTLTRSALARGYQVARKTVLNRTTTYQAELLTTGDQRRTQTLPDNTQALIETGTNGSRKTTFLDSTTPTRAAVSTTTLLEGPDPRFGMQSPIPSSLTTTTGGLTATLTTARTATLATPGDPLSLVTLTDTIKLNGRPTTGVYTKATRTAVATSPVGRKVTTVTDAQGRPVSLQVPGLDTVTMSYDTRGRLTSLSQGTGATVRTTTFAYNPAGFLQSVSDPLTRPTSFVYDLAGRVTQQTLPGSRIIAYVYDKNGNLISLTPPGRPAHTFGYTPVDLQAAYTPPVVAGVAAPATNYTYNQDKQLTRITRPDGGQLNYAYDPAGRLDTLTLPATRQYQYDYNAAGQLSRLTDPEGGTLDYTYSGALLTRITQGGDVDGSVGFTYDNDFRLKTVSVNGANPITLNYDADSLLTQAGALALSYNAQNGLLSGTTLGGITDAYTYNTFAEVASYAAKFNATTLYGATYTRDKLGRITQKAETVSGLTTTYGYAYDAAGRLDTVTKNGAPSADYGYDANGNRTSKTGPGVNEAGSYDNQDRLLTYTGATYTYTANGELKTKAIGAQTTTYAYDALGNLLSVGLPSGTQITYVIDGQNRRVGKKRNGTLEQGFLYQGQLSPVAELNGAGAVVSRFVYGTRANVPEYLIKGGVTYRIITDQLGSPRLVVNTATGAIAQRMDYDEFGNVTLDSSPGFQPFGFAGGLYDRDTKLVRFGARDYDPQTGRWTSKDPILFDGGDANLYGYVLDDPVNWVDPSGRFFWDIIDIGFFAESLLEFVQQPNFVTGCHLALDTIGLLPGIPSLGYFRRGGELAKSAGRVPGPVIDKATGQEVGRFIADSKGNVMIEPVGGRTVAAGKGGVDTHTLYPNGSNYQRLNPQGHGNNPTPHGHGHLPGTGPGMKGQGPSIDPQGNVVPWNSPEAHWPIR